MRLYKWPQIASWSLGKWRLPPGLLLQGTRPSPQCCSASHMPSHWKEVSESVTYQLKSEVSQGSQNSWRLWHQDSPSLEWPLWLTNISVVATSAFSKITDVGDMQSPTWDPFTLWHFFCMSTQWTWPKSSASIWGKPCCLSPIWTKHLSWVGRVIRRFWNEFVSDKLSTCQCCLWSPLFSGGAAFPLSLGACI